MQNPRKSYTVSEATRKMERYCAYQERCHLEVLQKLRKMGMIPEAADTIMAHLIETDFLNEERFSRAFAWGKFHQKRWGKNRIVRELKQRQVSAYNISAALSELSDEEYLETFHALALKRLAHLKEEVHPEKKKRKLADYLLYRGWEPEMVYEKVKELVR